MTKVMDQYHEGVRLHAEQLKLENEQLSKEIDRLSTNNFVLQNERNGLDENSTYISGG